MFRIFFGDSIVQRDACLCSVLSGLFFLYLLFSEIPAMNTKGEASQNSVHTFFMWQCFAVANFHQPVPRRRIRLVIIAHESGEGVGGRERAYTNIHFVIAVLHGMNG